MHTTNTQELTNLIITMGHIIRHLDDNNEYLEYWSLDGAEPGKDDYVLALDNLNT